MLGLDIEALRLNNWFAGSFKAILILNDARLRKVRSASERLTRLKPAVLER